MRMPEVARIAEFAQVVYVDAHVEWHTSPFAGPTRADRPFRDKIYFTTKGTNTETGGGGTVGDPGRPQERGDIFMLPEFDTKKP